MHLVSKLCCDLTWMTELQRKKILKNLKKEEGTRKNEIDGIIKEISNQEMEYLKKSSVPLGPSSRLSKVKREYVLPPVALITTCLLEGLEYPLAEGASHVIIGMFIASFMSFNDVRQKKEALDEGQKELKKERCKLDKDKFEFDKKRLNWELDHKKIDYQKTVMQIDTAETREAYLKTILDFQA